MATINVGLGAAGTGAEQVHAGINAVVCKISLSLTLSSGDVHNIGKLPNGAIPLDSVFYPGPALPGAAFTLKFGTSLSQEMFLTSATLTLTGAPYRTGGGKRLGYNQQISISDDARVLFDYITMVGTGTNTISVGHMGDLIVFYKMPGNTP
jgi:hypothetical protein